jgi:hypothetical protein
MMNLTEQERQKLLNFVGYGNPNGHFWFMGMEEGSGGIDDIQPNIDIRLKYFDPSIMDLSKAHTHLGWPKKLPSVWIYMARIVRAIGEEKAIDWWDIEKAKIYVCEQLGRESEDTFLTELLPLPKRQASKWPLLYKQSFGYKSRKIYEDEILCSRKPKLKALLHDKKPKYLFCYGETHYSHYKDIFPSKSWNTLPETKFEIASNDSTQVVLSPFWGNGRVGYRQMKILIDELNGH